MEEMQTKRKRSQNYTVEEKEKLLSLLLMHKDTILCKKTDGCTNLAKSRAWNDLTEQFNCSAIVYRNKDSLIKLWEKLKSEGKLYYSKHNKDLTGTGGGPSIVKIDPIMEQVCSIMGRGCTGILNIQDCDTDMSLPEYTVIVTEPSAEQEVVNNEAESQLSRELEDPVEVVQVAQPKQGQPVAMRQKPFWSRRRRPHLTKNSERSEAISTVCAGIAEVNMRKKDIEELKRNLVQEELDFKRNLFEVQLQTAKKQLEIQNEIFRQVKDGKILSYIMGAPQPSQDQH